MFVHPAVCKCDEIQAYATYTPFLRRRGWPLQKHNATLPFKLQLAFCIYHTKMTPSTVLSSRPWLSASLAANDSFWKAYISARPSPAESLFKLIASYHKEHSSCNALVHDVGTGPGNIAARLARYFDRIIGSDINPTALDSGRSMLAPELKDRITFVTASANDIHTIATPDNAKADLVCAGECLPLIESAPAVSSFHAALAPGGTAALYFYGRPIFVGADGMDATELNTAYAAIATKCTRPFTTSPNMTEADIASGINTSTTLASYLDNVRFDETQWTDVRRYKWNCDRPLLFGEPESYYVPPVVVDNKGKRDKVFEIHDRTYWQCEWTLEDVRVWILSTFPKIEEHAKDEWAEVEDLLMRFGEMMGGKVLATWTVVLVLATKK